MKTQSLKTTLISLKINEDSAMRNRRLDILFTTDSTEQKLISTGADIHISDSGQTLTLDFTKIYKDGNFQVF